MHNAPVELRPCHLHEKGILRQRKNYGNSNMSVRPSVGTRDLRSLWGAGCAGELKRRIVMSRTDRQTKQVLEIAADGFHGWVWVGCPHDWHFALKNICNQLVNICWLFKVSRRDPTLHIPLWVQSVGAKSPEWSSLQHFKLIKAYAKLIFFLLKPLAFLLLE